MIKVVAKTFAVLEFAAAHAGRPVLPGETAAALHLNQATTVRIMRDLLELGYLAQISRNKGYVLGPMARGVFERNHYRANLIRMAAPAVKDCAAQIGESVVLAVMQGARRYVLLHENRNPALNIDVSALYYDDLYLTATGRVLLAHANAADLNAVINKLHLPDTKVWPEAVTAPGMNRELRRIRQDGFVFFRSGQTGLQIMAAPIWEADKCLAALGASFPAASGARAKHNRTLAAVRTAAAKITQKLAVIRTAG